MEKLAQLIQTSLHVSVDIVEFVFEAGTPSSHPSSLTGVVNGVTGGDRVLLLNAKSPIVLRLASFVGVNASEADISIARQMGGLFQRTSAFPLQGLDMDWCARLTAPNRSAFVPPIKYDRKSSNVPNQWPVVTLKSIVSGFGGCEPDHELSVGHQIQGMAGYIRYECSCESSGCDSKTG